jgi:P-type conjugative transfer protein TrbJ
MKFSCVALLGASMFVLPVAGLAVLPTPAQAWRVVFDPTNYAQNVMQAARALQQVNQQITQLQNEAQMLVNQARNLTKLPYSAAQQLQANIQRTQDLMHEAQNIAYEVAEIDRAFDTTYGSASLTATDQQLVADARSRWQNTVGGLQDALRTQATVVGNIETSRAEMQALIERSQSAAGALSAIQAGNQLVALQAQQLADLSALMAANGRAEALRAAEQASAAEQGREQRRRFLAPGNGYQGGGARMFNGN